MKLRDILAAGNAHGVTVFCARCGRGVSMSVGMMIAAFGADREEPRSALLFKCSGCGKPATGFTWVFRERAGPDWATMRYGHWATTPIAR